jgi:hypothetical protein
MIITRLRYGTTHKKDELAICLQMASRKTLPVFMEAIMGLTLGQCALQIWVFTVKITEDLILELDNILCASDISVNLKHHVLQLDEEVSPYTTAFDNILPA